jgi:hypothetical protein
MVEMKEYEATEIAYKRGYEQGMKDAVKHGRWESKGSNIYCTNCGKGYRISVGGPNVFLFKHCPECGAKMDLEEEA